MTTPPAHPPAWFAALTDARVASGQPTEVTSITHDSRTAEPGSLFVALPGLTVDGTAYIGRALEQGARAVVVQLDRKEVWEQYCQGDVAVVAVPDARVALAEASAGFHTYPARTLGSVGVTGTDGKTTTTHLIAHVLNANGVRAGHMSSVEFGVGEDTELNRTHMTTVEANDVQLQLARMRDVGARVGVLEASSIGLDLHRVDECEFDVGVFTNLTPDHLDYHGTMERYRDAKAILFRMVGESMDKGFAKTAILNADDAASDAFKSVTTAATVSYGLKQSADVTATDLRAEGFGMHFIARKERNSVRARVPLLGDYNVANCLAAIAASTPFGVSFSAAAASLESFPGVPGRMERVEEGQPFGVIVDIASTEQAMRNVLRMLRLATTGRLIVVFGAAGERDVARRSTIARAVAEHADYAVITNEDPRDEDPEAIIAEIAAAFRQIGFTGFASESDRRSAIRLAFDMAREGDTVLLAGKGTEQSIVIGDTHHPWDERRVARELLRGRQ